MTKKDDAVRTATGRDWTEWLSLLDAAGAAEWDHQGIVKHLAADYPQVSSWWQQSITVAYERARGKRAIGETASGFQVGVQRSVAAGADVVWKVLTERPELWLGGPVRFEPGNQYEGGGVSGEIRVVKPVDRVRFTWRRTGWDTPATVQVSLLGEGKTVVHALVEKLPDAQSREWAREQWRIALERIATEAGS
ncbi:SRPBCC domain-containing protein [Crossiella sp. NPDC003009]